METVHVVVIQKGRTRKDLRNIFPEFVLVFAKAQNVTPLSYQQ